MNRKLPKNSGKPPKSRVWELDALRGFLILCVILAHLSFDIEAFYPGWLQLPGFVQFLFHYGGVLFVLLSGICTTLGSRSLRRGLIVLGCGLGLQLATAVLARLGVIGQDGVIRFGVLHLLGTCMILYPLLKKLPIWWLTAMGLVMIVVGYWLTGVSVECRFLYAIGLCSPEFASGDFFPLLPNLGWFSMGIVLGRRFYSGRKSLLPRVNENFFLLRFFRFCGRQSLPIYLLHQPLLFGVLWLINTRG